MKNQPADLNSRSSITSLDKSNMLSSIESLGLQVEHAWTETLKIKFTAREKIKNVVVAGMGGSALGADVIKNLFIDSLTVPFDIVRNYNLPVYVDQSTLVILSSYSGNTEEVVSCSHQAQAKGAQIMVIAAGGKLADLASKNDWPAYIIEPKFNPSNQPRMAIGYSVFGTIGLCSQAGLLQIKQAEIEAVIATIQRQISLCTIEISAKNNPAKNLAFLMLDHRSVIVGSEFLEGAVHVATNQSNENAKTFTDYKIIPEMNHHLLEAFSYPGNLKGTHSFFFVQSELYGEQNQLRVELTHKAVVEAGMDSLLVEMTAGSKIEQVWECISLFAFTGFYLAILEGIDPSPIPHVEDFKKKLV